MKKDCNDPNILKYELNRICTKYSSIDKKKVNCIHGCPLYHWAVINKHAKLGVIPWPDNMPFINIVQEWSDRFEEFTRLEMLLKTFPNTILEYGLPQFCPDKIGYTISQKYCQPTDNIEKCQKCWNSPYYIEKNIGDTLTKKESEMNKRLMALRFYDNRK